MFRRALGAFVFVLPVVAALISGCGTPEEPGIEIISSPTDGLVKVTDTFNGTLLAGGTNYHTFHTMQGVLAVTLVSVDPAVNAPLVGMAIGMWDGISCQVVMESAASVPTSVLVGTASLSSTVCIKVWDPSTMAAESSLKYQITAEHNEKPTS
jgi:hypothetical protein